MLKIGFIFAASLILALILTPLAKWAGGKFNILDRLIFLRLRKG
jgi:hypothetical protein